MQGAFAVQNLLGAPSIHLIWVCCFLLGPLLILLSFFLLAQPPQGSITFWNRSQKGSMPVWGSEFGRGPPGIFQFCPITQEQQRYKEVWLPAWSWRRGKINENSTKLIPQLHFNYHNKQGQTKSRDKKNWCLSKHSNDIVNVLMFNAEFWIQAEISLTRMLCISMSTCKLMQQSDLAPPWPPKSNIFHSPIPPQSSSKWPWLCAAVPQNCPTSESLFWNPISCLQPPPALYLFSSLLRWPCTVSHHYLIKPLLNSLLLHSLRGSPGDSWSTISTALQVSLTSYTLPSYANSLTMRRLNFCPISMLEKVITMCQLDSLQCPEVALRPSQMLSNSHIQLPLISPCCLVPLSLSLPIAFQ